MMDRAWFLDGVLIPPQPWLVPFREAVALGFELDGRAYESLRKEYGHYLEVRWDVFAP